MPRLLFLFVVACAVWSQQTSTTPDVQSSGASFAFTGNGDSSALSARSTSAGQPAVAWRVTYEAPATVTGVTVTLQGAPDNGSGAPGTWVTFAGTSDEGTNPLSTLTTGAFNVRPGTTGVYYPWVRIDLSNYAGSGTVNTKVLGYRGTNPAPPASGSSGPSPLPTISPCNTTAQVALSGTGYTQIIAGSSTKVIYLCKVFVTSVAMAVPVVNTFTYAFGTCAGSPTAFLTGGGVTGLDEDFDGGAQSAASAAFCVKETVANSDLVTVVYAQK